MLGEGLDADALLAPLSQEAALLLAVSGGPDSVALMLLAARWSQRAQRNIAVATVDHGLRANSREEAEQVGAWARALGFSHRLLHWRGAKPATRLQERAREARYALLADCARTVSAQCAIVTAHHADDQAETILFRLTRGSGVAGLRGMAPVSTRDGLRLLRPLLGVSKRALEGVCVAAAHPFFRDPSNANESFARARLRALSATLAAQGLTTEGLLRLGRRAARADAALAWATARAAERAVEGAAERAALTRAEGEAEGAEGEARLDASALRALPVEILQRLLEQEIRRLGAAEPLRLERLERVADAVFGGLSAGGRLKMTLGGVLVALDATQLILRPAPQRRSARVQSDTSPTQSLPRP